MSELTEIGFRQYLVESRSHPGTHYAVSWEPDDATGEEFWGCTCEGWGFRRECRHTRIVQLYEAGLASFKEQS